MLDPYVSWKETSVNDVVLMQEFQTLEDLSEHFAGIDLCKRFSALSVCEGFCRLGEINRHIFRRIRDYVFRHDDVSLWNISIAVRRWQQPAKELTCRNWRR